MKDLIVIGGGPGGYVAAIRAAQLGASVVLIEQAKLGGTCLHQGCIPTKALYKNAEILNSFQEISKFGISLRNGYDFDLQLAQKRKQEIIDRLEAGIVQLLEANGVQVIKGKGRLLNNTTVEIITEDAPFQLQAETILLATGSKSSLPPIPGVELSGVLTSEEALALDHIPKSLTIIGGGVIGIEFAGIFQSFGTQVTVLELLPRILPQVDAEIVRRLTPLLRKRGIQIMTNVSVSDITRENDSLKIQTKGKNNDEGTTFSSDYVLLSAGRSANFDKANLAEAEIEHDRNGIKVDSNFQTSLTNVYAIGDVIGGQMLAHVASEQGKAVAEHLYASKQKQSRDKLQPDKQFIDKASSVDNAPPSDKDYFAAVPSCIFTFPEIATVGLTEEEAKQTGIPYIVSKFMFAANGKALTLGETDGLVKIIAEKQSKKILGVHILGPHASDLIPEATLAIAHNLKAEDLLQVIHAHPTLSESFHEAILGLDDQAIHLAPKGVK